VDAFWLVAVFALFLLALALIALCDRRGERS
jgi:hypothetical protein